MAWIIEGIERDEVISDFALVNGGAAGLEVDRNDYAQGTSPIRCCWPAAVDELSEGWSIARGGR